MKKMNTKNKIFRKITSYGLILLMLASLTGCGTSLNGAVSKDGKSVQNAQGTEKVTEQDGTKTSATEKYLDVAGATEADYSKYEKSTDGKQATVGNEKGNGDASKVGADTDNANGVIVDATKGLTGNNNSGNTTGNKSDVNTSSNSKDSKSENTCTLTVTCATILDHKKDLAAGKEKLVPSDGIIYSNKKVTFQKGDTVFDVLQREMKANRIQMEFTSAPAYNCDYVEAIDNLYEFDCGQTSGWKYSVNGEFPNYGCSQYELKDQDVIQWAYTCDLGKDLEKK
jgi:uncharacterized protein YceK